jgi:hypothetical protein
MVLEKRLLVFTVFLSLLIIPSCTKRGSLKRVCSGYVSEDEARFSDIPFYVGARNFSVTTYQATTQIDYQLRNSVENGVRFYELQMEREGWIAKAKWQSTDTILYFVKGSADCLIVFSPHNSFIQVSIKLSKAPQKEMDESL